MLQKKDNRAAGELEGAKAPLEIGLIAIKNAWFIRLFDERSEIFRENLFSQKMWRFEAWKKSQTFFRADILSAIFSQKLKNVNC